MDKYRLVLSRNSYERTFATPNEDYAFYGITSPTTLIYQLNANDGTFVRAISLSLSFDVRRTNIKITSDSTKLVLNINQGANSEIWYNLIGTNSFQLIFYLLKSGWTALTVISYQLFLHIEIQHLEIWYSKNLQFLQDFWQTGSCQL